MTIKILFLNVAIGFAGAWFMARYAFRFGLMDRPNDRCSHVTPTPRGGVGSCWALFLIVFKG
ncbi:MAG: hypothetical protein PF495_01270, partial [Spirochaetales bacterium]|nr:hypothetical protein [Spirochaetales bacterium]